MGLVRREISGLGDELGPRGSRTQTEGEGVCSHLHIWLSREVTVLLFAKVGYEGQGSFERTVCLVLLIHLKMFQ